MPENNPLLRTYDFEFEAEPLAPRELKKENFSTEKNNTQGFKPISLNQVSARPFKAKRPREVVASLNPKPTAAIEFKKVGVALGFIETAPSNAKNSEGNRYQRLSQVGPQQTKANFSGVSATSAHLNTQESTDFHGLTNASGSRETLGELSDLVLKDKGTKPPGLGRIAKNNREASFAVSEPVVMNSKAKAPLTHPAVAFQSAAMGIRFLAFCIDNAAVVFLTSVVLVGSILMASQLNVQLVVPNDVFIRFDGLFIQLAFLFSVVFFCYHFAFNFLFQQTPGAFALHLRLQPHSGQPVTMAALFKRTVIQLLSLLVLPVYFWVLLNKERRALHDWLSDNIIQSY